MVAQYSLGVHKVIAGWCQVNAKSTPSRLNTPTNCNNGQKLYLTLQLTSTSTTPIKTIRTKTRAMSKTLTGGRDKGKFNEISCYDDFVTNGFEIVTNIEVTQ